MNPERQLDFFQPLTAVPAPQHRIPVSQPAPAPASPASALSGTLIPCGPDPRLEAQAKTLLQGLGCTALAECVRVVWNPRMRSTAGSAHGTRVLISLNPRLLSFGPDEVDRTFLHELAHLLAHHRAGRKRISPHGPEWRVACRDLGLTDEKRCHELPLPRRQLARRHLYRCPQCAVEVQRVRPLRRKMACLKCCQRHSHGRYDERFRFVKVVP